MAFLEINNVSKQYAKHLALDNVSMQIPEKSIFGLLGPNGAGKTSLIRIINQITAPDTGEVSFNGEKLNAKHIAQIGYLPEERGLYKKMKIGEQILYLSQLKGLSKKEATKRVKYWFEKFEMQTWWKKTVGELSKGMQQKVQFISTVIHEPQLLILDEPFTGFDPINTQIIKDEILNLRAKGATVIFSTHRMESVEELCDDIALINKSKKVLEGKKQDIKNQYKSNTFIIDYEGEFPKFETDVELKPAGNGSFAQAKIQIPENQQPNDLLQKLIPSITIHEFKEHIPSINEIFIKVVKD